MLLRCMRQCLQQLINGQVGWKLLRYWNREDCLRRYACDDEGEFSIAIDFNDDNNTNLAVSELKLELLEFLALIVR